MRATASEEVEMVSQLLFGDTFRIMEELPRWYRIVRDCDEYEGWIDWKTATIIKELEYQQYRLNTENALLLRQPYNVIARTGSGPSASLYLSWGSRIFNLDDMGISFQMQGYRFDVPNMTYVNPMKASAVSRNACAKFLLQQAQMLANVPYLWGGCSAFGIDCSGFTQTLFRFIGINLPRNASQQAKEGISVSYENRLVGDLAFFNHGEGNTISHVGVCDDHGRILHCSASLHFDEFRPEGIWNLERQELSHQLVCLRRLF
mgnify:CR=1 FL=1